MKDSVGDRPQLAGCAGASFAIAVIAQLNPDSFVTNNGSRGTDAAHMHALPARLYIAMTNACAMMSNALCATVHKTVSMRSTRFLRNITLNTSTTIHK